MQRTEDKFDEASAEEFLILHEGWEVDNVGWITRDGAFTTSHGGRPYRMTSVEIRKHIEKTERSLHGLRRALNAVERQDGLLLVHSPTPGTYLVHEAGQRPVEGVAVHYYGGSGRWVCERDGTPHGTTSPGCVHIRYAKESGE